MKTIINLVLTVAIGCLAIKAYKTIGPVATVGTQAVSVAKILK